MNIEKKSFWKSAAVAALLAAGTMSAAGEVAGYEIGVKGDTIELRAENGGPLPRGEKFRVSIAGKTFELDTDRPVVTREMLPPFISRSSAILTDLADAKNGLKTKFANFRFLEQVPLTVEYKGKTRECRIDTSVFMTGEELWNCGWACAAKKDAGGGKKYLLLAAEKEYPPAMFLIGGSYLKGDGLEKNVEKGLAYMKKAADAGYADSGLKLAEMYLTMQDVRKKLPPGMDIEIMLAGSGSDDEKKLMRFVLSITRADARKYCEAALKRNDKNADTLYMMARLMLEDGQIRPALKHLKAAAAMKHDGAAKLLANYRTRLKEDEDFGYYSENNDPVVARVKRCVFGLNRSLTLEQALADQLDDMRWRKVRKARQNIVEVVGVWNNDRFKGENTLPQQNEEVMIQFSVSKSGRIRFHYGELRNADGSMKKFMGMVPAHTDQIGYLDKNGFIIMMYGEESSSRVIYKPEFLMRMQGL